MRKEGEKKKEEKKKGGMEERLKTVVNKKETSTNKLTRLLPSTHHYLNENSILKWIQ